MLSPDDKTKDVFDQLEKLLIKETKTWWDHNSLKRYVDRKMVSRGLRISKRPITLYSTSFEEEWNSILTDCSIALMNLIIKHESDKLVELQGEIMQLRTSLPNLSNNTPVMEMNSKIENNIEKLELTIMEIKKSKFKRDLEDYNKNVVHNWHILRLANRTPHSLLRNRSQDCRGGQDSTRVSFS